MEHQRDDNFTLVDVKTRIPEHAAKFIGELVERGYFLGIADFARQAILDKLIDDFELGMAELEPGILASRNKEATKEKEQKKGDKVA